MRKIEESKRRVIYWEPPLELKEECRFYYRLAEAWDALAYDRYLPGGMCEREAGCRLDNYYHAYSATEGITIKLNELEIRAIDALAEAVGIPHQQGQTEIGIPEKLRHYGEYRKSKEYKELVAKTRQDRISEFKKLTS